MKENSYLIESDFFLLGLLLILRHLAAQVREVNFGQESVIRGSGGRRVEVLVDSLFKVAHAEVVQLLQEGAADVSSGQPVTPHVTYFVDPQPVQFTRIVES